MAWVHSEVLCFSPGLRIPLATCLVLEAQPPGTVQAGVMRPPTLCQGTQTSLMVVVVLVAISTHLKTEVLF